MAPCNRQFTCPILSNRYRMGPGSVLAIPFQGTQAIYHRSRNSTWVRQARAQLWFCKTIVVFTPQLEPLSRPILYSSWVFIIYYLICLSWSFSLLFLYFSFFHDNTDNTLGYRCRAQRYLQNRGWVLARLPQRLRYRAACPFPKYPEISAWFRQKKCPGIRTFLEWASTWLLGREYKHSVQMQPCHYIREGESSGEHYQSIFKHSRTYLSRTTMI